jgi:hypothetical protein
MCCEVGSKVFDMDISEIVGNNVSGEVVLEK